MSDDFAHISTEVRDWFADGHDAGWISDGDFERFTTLEQATPEDLFKNAEARPLVVAFFGGTGVGKSSLLNRMAGEPIARVGVERPTSREITMYMHESVELASFPETLPVENVQIRRHNSESRKGILWVDMPDIDSTEAANRDCVMRWLPHIDLLVYVVSPERYRDDVGWRVLLKRNLRHGWMFVMNRWDEGDPSQRGDLTTMLEAAGFEDPLVLVTSCDNTPKLPTEDEFHKIEQTLHELLDAHGVRELTRLGHRARLTELRNALQQAAEHLGDDERWNDIKKHSQPEWRKCVKGICEGLEWPMRSLAKQIGDIERGNIAHAAATAIASAVKGSADQPQPAVKPTAQELAQVAEDLWDDWAETKLFAHLDVLENTVRHHNITPGNLRQQLEVETKEAELSVRKVLNDMTRSVLANPGNPLQRGARIVTGFLKSFLPISTMVLVAYNGVAMFLDGNPPDSGFAVTGMLLVAFAWAVPFWLDRKLKPSVEGAVQRGLREGILVGLEAIEGRFSSTVEKVQQSAMQRRGIADKIIKRIGGMLVRPVRSDRVEIGRLVATKAK